jgi:hypothetical protein
MPGVSNHVARAVASSFETHRHSRPKDGVASLAYGDAPQDEQKLCFYFGAGTMRM